MIEFRFPFILYLYIPLFIFIIFLIFKNKSQPALGEISKELRNKLLIDHRLKDE